MPFKVKGTVIDFLGDEEKYPCHFKHKIGDEVIFDGEKVIGRICPGFLSGFITKALAIYPAGPRYKEPSYYFPFYYTSISVHDDSMKKYDGLGFKPVLETAVESSYHMCNLAPADAFKWPPHDERTVRNTPTVICNDLRTSALMKLEAFDLSDKGYTYPFFRRQMVIINKVTSKPGIKSDQILGEFSKTEREEIYPALGNILVQALVEELVLMDYLELKEDKVIATHKGQKKLHDFISGLDSEEREALKLPNNSSAQ